MLNKFFITYMHSNDGAFFDLLCKKLSQLSENKKLVNLSITSKDFTTVMKPDYVIRENIKQRIFESDLIFCILGEKTHSRTWILWEIKTAKSMKKRIIFIKKEEWDRHLTSLWKLDVKEVIDWYSKKGIKQLYSILENENMCPPTNNVVSQPIMYNVLENCYTLSHKRSYRLNIYPSFKVI